MSVLDIRLTEAKVNDLLGFKRKTVSGHKCSVTRDWFICAAPILHARQNKINP